MPRTAPRAPRYTHPRCIRAAGPKTWILRLTWDGQVVADNHSAACAGCQVVASEATQGGDVGAGIDKNADLGVS